MLAMANKYGVVEASLPGLADLARVTVDECKDALSTLSNPDPYSRSKSDEGRRIREVPGGWFLINYPAYREKLGTEERREYLRIKQQESRARKRQQKVNSALTGIQSQHIAEAEAEAYTEGSLERVRAREGMEKVLAFLQSTGLKIYKRPADQKTSYTEESAAIEIISRPNWEKEHAEILAYFEKLPPSERRFFPNSLATLLSNWTVTLDRARNFKPENYGHQNNAGNRGRSHDRNAGTCNEGKAHTYKAKPYVPKSRVPVPDVQGTSPGKDVGGDK